MQRLQASLVIMLVAASCAHGASVRDDASSRGNASGNASFDEQTRQATQPIPLREGRELEQLGLGGYITLQEGDENGPTDTWQTVFYSSSDPPKALFRVQQRAGLKPVVETLAAPEDLFSGMEVLIRARSTAIYHLSRPARGVSA